MSLPGVAGEVFDGGFQAEGDEGEQCQQRDWSPVPLAGTGTLVSHTVIRVAPRGRGGEVPYAVAVVRLDEGVSLLGRVVGIPFESLKSGLPVRFRSIQLDQQTIIGFGPA